MPSGSYTTASYGYSSGSWGDLMMSFNGTNITYDAIGNPLSYYGNRSFTWEGRRLAGATASGKAMTFKYNEEGIRTSKTVNGVTTTNYYLNGSQLVAEETNGNITVYLYNNTGIIGFQYHASSYAASDWDTYFYEKSLQGDIVAVYDANGVKKISYTYDAWGNFTATYHSGASSSSLNNPFTYRGYYYDKDLGLYYLNSRYYDSNTCRFINSDNQLSTGSDLTGLNLFAYCGNNPVNRIDPTGEAWWHWVLGAAVVAACAVATVVTCGGFAAAATAVSMVGSGVAAATTASTVAAGAFIGSATVYGMAVVTAASTSNSVQEFSDQGNWGTVAGTALGGLTGGYDGYTMSKAQAPISTPTNTSSGSTGRTEPANLREKLAMEQVKSNPSAGTPLTKITLNDPRWLSSDGWVKMQQIVPTSEGYINIHYVYNQTLKIFDDFKFNP